MQWLNYHHLLYFWAVARHGSVKAASKQLHLAQPTISGQIRTLEESLGEKLFAKAGRGLELTEVGHTVYRYADEIFSLGRELKNTLEGRPTGRPQVLRVGITEVMPKLISHRLLAPLFELEQPIRLVCHEDKTDRLLANLAIHQLDVVLADAPLGPNARVKAFNHLLGECGVSFFARPELSAQLSGDFPQCLEEMPMLLPTTNTQLRRSLDQWFNQHQVQPQIVGEFDDSALLKVFGEHGGGIFAGATLVEDELCEIHGLEIIGRAEEVKERFYSITIERRIKHPAARAISDNAHRLFG